MEDDVRGVPTRKEPSEHPFRLVEVDGGGLEQGLHGLLGERPLVVHERLGQIEEDSRHSSGQSARPRLAAKMASPRNALVGGPANAATAEQALGMIWAPMPSVTQRFGQVDGLVLQQRIDRAYLIGRNFTVPYYNEKRRPIT